jgi:hypothetical protein
MGAGLDGGIVMVRYFDRQGNPIDMMEWAQRLCEKWIAKTTLPDGTWISTVWRGIDHQYGDGPPLIFETMVFPSENGPFLEEECERYSTEAEAIAGHEAMVAKWSDRTAT